jgi:hypothetical protein
MPKQKSVLKLEGSIGDITFYKSKDGYLAREKSDIGSKVKSDPAFQRTRENGAEFGRAGKAGKLVRDAFRPLLQSSSDSRMTSRLTKEMMKALKADSTSARGERNVLDGDLGLVQGFEFNLYSSLSSTCFVPFTTSIDRPSGQLGVNLPAFDPLSGIAAPAGATHFKLVTAAAAIDFAQGAYEVAFAEMVAAPVNGPIAALNLQNNLAANSSHPLFLLLGIEFYQEVNGNLYPLKNGAFNSLCMVGVAAV